MGIYKIKPLFQKFLEPITNLLVKHAVSPDLINLGGIVTSVVMVVSFWLAQEAHGWLILSAICVPLRLAMNALDGQVARALEVDDPLGEAKNELSDRLADAITFGGLCFITVIPLYLSIPALVLTLLIGYMGILSKAITGVREYAGIMAKPDRVIVIAIACLLTAFTASWAWFSIALVSVIVLGLHTIWLRWGKIRQRLANPIGVE